MSLAETLMTLRGRILSRSIQSKAEVRQGAVLGLLHELDWPVFDTRIVRPSHHVNGDAVDFALLGEHGELRVVIVVDAPSHLEVEAVDPSLYLTGSDQPVVIHTNGLIWRFMLSATRNGVPSHESLTVPLCGNSASERFVSLLKRNQVEDGHARNELARLLARKPVEAAAIMDAWLSLLDGTSPALTDLLAGRVEANTGRRPTTDEIAAFFRAADEPTLPRESASEEDISEAYQSLSTPTLVEEPLVGSQVAGGQGAGLPSTHSIRTSGCWFRFDETRLEARTGKGVVLGILRHLEKQSPGLLRKVAEHPDNLGTSRRYIARSPAELYPERPDLAADSGKYSEIVPGWFLMTNFNTDVKRRIISLIGSIAGIVPGQDFDYSLDRR